MIVKKEGGTIKFISNSPNEYIKVIVESNTDIEVVKDLLVSGSYSLPLSHIGAYQVYVGINKAYPPEPTATIFYYDPVITDIASDYLFLFGSCDDCGGYKPCTDHSKTADVLCLLNKVYSLILSFPSELESVFNILSITAGANYKDKFLKNIQKDIYYGKKNCCEKETVELLSAGFLTLYYVYSDLYPNDTDYTKEIFDSEDVIDAMEDNGVPVDTITEQVENEVGPIVTAPNFNGYTIQVTEVEDGVPVDYIFSYQQFQNHFVTNGGSPSDEITIATLPAKGSLSVNGVDVTSVPQTYPKAGFSLKYEVFIETDFPNEFVPYDSFYVQMSNQDGVLSNYGQILIEAMEYENSPPTIIGDNDASIANRATYTFTVSDFTTGTTPQYFDPEGDPADAIKVVNTNFTGNLYIWDGSGKVPVVLNQIVLISDILAGNLRYDGPNINEASVGNFEFEVRDTGSMTFTDEPVYGIFTISTAVATNQPPVANDDNYTVELGSTTLLDVLDNDNDPEGDDLTITIVTPPSYGTAAVVGDQIQYVNDNSENYLDTLQYKVNDGSNDSNIATVTISVTANCEQAVTYNGAQGVYEIILNLGTDTGDVVVTVDGYNLPNRFQIEYDGAIVGDSYYIGDAVENSAPYFVDANGTHILDIFEHDGSDFINTGLVESVTIGDADFRKFIEPGFNTGGGGNDIMIFSKPNAYPTTAKITVYAPMSDAVWSLAASCPSNSPAPEVVYLFYGDSDLAITDSVQIRNQLTQSIGIKGEDYLFINNQRKNTILVPQGWVIDTIISSDNENLIHNFDVVPFDYIDTDTTVIPMVKYSHSSVIPLDVDIIFKLKL